MDDSKGVRATMGFGQVCCIAAGLFAGIAIAGPQQCLAPIVAGQPYFDVLAPLLAEHTSDNATQAGATSVVEGVDMAGPENPFGLPATLLRPRLLPSIPDDLRVVSGTITRNLIYDGKRAGMKPSVSLALADIFTWDIDFSHGLYKGDTFDVILGSDDVTGDAVILSARFKNRGKLHTAVRYVHEDGRASYYTEDGLALHKAFLRNPVDFFRISSKYNPDRFHPVLGVRRPHDGVDFAAAAGTPIKATGSGRVLFAGTKGGYGRTIILEHPGGITTLYAHQSRIARGIRSNVQVEQGQVIGYVGATGVATGPHLHYEFRIDGVHQDPLTVPLEAHSELKGHQLQKFRLSSSRLLALMAPRQEGTELAHLNAR